MFEFNFLTPANADLYQRQVAKTASIVAACLPDRPYSGRTPSALAELIPADFLPQAPSSQEAIAATLRAVVANSLPFSHPYIAAHLHPPPLLDALAAELVISSINQSMDSFDLGPLAAVTEQKLVRWMCSEAGLPPTADGTFTTGGSQSNHMGLLLARDAFLKKQWNWSAQRSGLPPDARRLRIICSDVAHFTVDQSAHQLGLGTDAVVRVPVDGKFRMDEVALRDALQTLRAEDLLPMAMVATAGTTDFGSIDPLPAMAELARKWGIWLHVDAAYGGALLFSDTHRNKLRGLEAADSVAIDFHKLFWQPIPSAVFLLRDASHFDAIKLHADYLNPKFHEDEGIPDLVTKSLLTSRRFDALKVWICFQTLGRAKLGAMIDRTIALAALAAEAVRHTPRLELVAEPNLGTVVFRYVPSQPGADTDLLNDRIRRRLFDDGAAVIGHTRVHGLRCLKFTCMNPSVSDAQMRDLVELVRKQGAELDIP